MNIEQTFDEGERLLARVWKLIAAQGVAAIVFAIVLLVWPDIGLSAMVAIVGAFALITGCAAAVAAFELPGEARDIRIWLAFQALIGIGIGIAVLVWPDLSAKALLYVIGAWAIAAGATKFAASIALPLTAGESLLLALNGIVLTGFGVVMFVKPGAGAIGLLALVAAYAFVEGVFALALAREVRHAADEAKRVVPRPRPGIAVQG
jgi:uncharacterized membrane protein HdeD (DUF308 family)